MPPQYDISPERRKVLQENANRRLTLRNEFLMKQSDPFRHASSEGGTVFDPAYLRYQAMRVSSYEHFKPNLKNIRIGFFSIIVPMGLYVYIVQSMRKTKEDKLRKGEVAYKDRDFKFI